MHASEIWESTRFADRLVRGALLPASWIYAAGWEAYLCLYRSGLKKEARPHHPIICVGNLQVGGSGKTPVSLNLWRELTANGHKVVLSSSGYGSPRAESASLAPSGSISASEWGDEPAMLRWQEPELPLVVGRDRVKAAELVNEFLPDHLMLMDDGFQHLRLGIDVSIVLDPEHPANTACLPCGPYREPRKNRKRADIVVPRDVGLVSEPTSLQTPAGEPTAAETYSLLCAIGNPRRLMEDLQRHCPSKGGFAKVVIRPDHDTLAEGTLLDSFPEGIPVVVTAKDWVKLRERSDLENRRFIIATQTLRLETIDGIERRLSGAQRTETENRHPRRVGEVR